jgi:hypothetical protein
MSTEAMKRWLQCAERCDAIDGMHSWSDVVEEMRQAIAEAEQAQPVAISDEWQPCVKLPVAVHVRAQRPGEAHVSTREGITPVKPDDLIMRGVSGEEYPIGREIFEKTYRLGEAPPPRQPLTDVVKAAQSVLEWTEIAHRPPVRDRLEAGRMVGVRLHALADLHDALTAHGIKENT